jgi:HEAT repeat protein
MKTVVLATLALWLLAESPGRAQLSTSSQLPNQSLGAPKDPADVSARYQKGVMGQTMEDWARHLEDPDPGRRLEAVKLLAESGPKANQYLIRAVDNPDAAVATSAVDSLGKLAAKEASDVLAEKLFLASTNAALRQHILVALGRIRDPASARRVLAFAQGEADADVRATAIRVVGEIGDETVHDDLRKFSETETDPKLKSLLQDAEAKIAMHRAGSGTVETDSLSKFSHSEPSP